MASVQWNAHQRRTLRRIRRFFERRRGELQMLAAAGAEDMRESLQRAAFTDHQEFRALLCCTLLPRPGMILAAQGVGVVLIP